MYDQRGCECPSCGKVFYNLFLEDLKIDTKILLLQKIAGITTFDTSHAAGQNTNGLQGLYRNHKSFIFESIFNFEHLLGR